MGRRLVVLGSAPAFEEVADEEGVEDAISSVVLGPLLSGVLGQSRAGTGCKEKRERCGEGFRGPAREATEQLGARTLPQKSGFGTERREEGHLTGWVGVRGGEEETCARSLGLRRGQRRPGLLSSLAAERGDLECSAETGEPKASAKRGGAGDRGRRALEAPCAIFQPSQDKPYWALSSLRAGRRGGAHGAGASGSVSGSRCCVWLIPWKEGG